MITQIIDRPCGAGKSVSLRQELIKKLELGSIENYLIVVPDLSEVETYKQELSDWFCSPEIDGDLGFTTKIEALKALLSDGRNIITTHSLYEQIKHIEDYLWTYHVIIDEVPTPIQIIDNQLGKGTFRKVILDCGYVEVDPKTGLVTVTDTWDKEKDDFSTIGSDMKVRRFMDKVSSGNVINITDTFFVMPIPDAFFDSPQSLTILTFLFEGSLLSHYMNKVGYEYEVQSDLKELSEFKQLAKSYLKIYGKTSKVRCSYTQMSQKDSNSRKTLNNWVRNNVAKELKDNELSTEDLLVVTAKDAYHATGNVSSDSAIGNKNKLQDATWIPAICRGTNQYSNKKAVLYATNVNLQPNLAKYLDIGKESERNHIALSEMIQVIWRTAIRKIDPEEVLLFMPDKISKDILENWLNSEVK